LWKRRPLNSLHFHSVGLKPNQIFIDDNLSLIIQEIELEENGTYYCFNRAKLYAIHHVEVIKDEPFDYLVSAQSKPKVKMLDDERLKDNNLIVKTEWQKDWTECNKCDMPGIRKKNGLCKVYVIYKYY